MADRRETLLIERMIARADELGLNDRQLSLQVTGKPDLVRDIKRKGHAPSADNLARLAEILGVSVDWLLGRADTPEPVRSAVSVSDRHIDWHGPTPGERGIPIVGTGDCADLAVDTLEGERVEVERSSFDPDYHVRYIARPPAFRGATDLYAIHFHGDSMEPRWEEGEVGIVDPRSTPRAGQDVLVQLRADGTEDVVTVLVKRLVRTTADYYELQQFNPPLTFRLPKRQVKRIHRVLRPTDLLL